MILCPFQPQIILVDEIGKMELFSRDFIDFISAYMVNSSVTIICTVAQKCNHKLVELIKTDRKTELITVTKDNRDSLFQDKIEKVLLNCPQTEFEFMTW